MPAQPDSAPLSPERTALLSFLEGFRHDVATLPDADLVNAIRKADRALYDTFVIVDGEGPRECANCQSPTYGETTCAFCD